MCRICKTGCLLLTIDISIFRVKEVTSRTFKLLAWLAEIITGFSRSERARSEKLTFHHLKTLLYPCSLYLDLSKNVIRFPLPVIRA